MNNDYKIAKLEKQAQDMRLIVDLMKNPVVELLAGIIAISFLNKGDKSWVESLTGIDLKAGGEYAGLVAIIGLQQLAPLAPYIAQGAEGIGKTLPGILSLAGTL